MAADPMIPFHVEAYPTIDLREARKRVLAGHDHVLWREQEGSLVAVARMSFDHEDVLTIELQVRKLAYIPAGLCKHRIACQVVRRDEGQDDVLTTSGKVGERCRVIVFAEGEWRSQVCQRLAYRSTIISASVHASERLAELDVLLAEGRQRYGRRSVHDELVRERQRLVQQLGDRRALPPLHQRYVLTRSWMAAPSPEFEIARLPPTPAGIPDVTDVLELVGEPLFSGASLQEDVEAALSAEVQTVYRRLSASSSRVSALQVRKALGSMKHPQRPTLEPDLDLLPVEAGSLPFHAVLSVALLGDERLFRTGLPRRLTVRLPIGDVAHGMLTLEVAFTPENIGFVPLMLQSELNLVSACLKRQAEAILRVQADYPATVRRIVSERWSSPKAARNRR